MKTTVAKTYHTYKQDYYIRSVCSMNAKGSPDDEVKEAVPVVDVSATKKIAAPETVLVRVLRFLLVAVLMSTCILVSMGVYRIAKQDEQD